MEKKEILIDGWTNLKKLQLSRRFLKSILKKKKHLDEREMNTKINIKEK